MSEKGRILADRYELKELIGQGGMQMYILHMMIY